MYFLASNAIMVGATGGMMAEAGQLDIFLQLIAPHGLLELTAVFVAGAAGLRIFWAWVAPGPRTAVGALAEEARALFTVAIGLVGVLAVSGLIEGFVTGSGLPWWVKIGHRRARAGRVLDVRDRARPPGSARRADGRPRAGPLGLRARDRRLSRRSRIHRRRAPRRRRP